MQGAGEGGGLKAIILGLQYEPLENEKHHTYGQ